MMVRRPDFRFTESVPQAYSQEIIQFLEVGLHFLWRFGLWALLVSCCGHTQDLASGSTTLAGTSASLATAACLCCWVGLGPGSGADVPYMALKMLFKAAKQSRYLWYLRLGCLANGWLLCPGRRVRTKRSGVGSSRGTFLNASSTLAFP